MPPLISLPRLIAIRRIRSIVLHNKDFGFRLPLRQRLRAWRHWFGSRDWLLYDLDHNDPGEYLPHHVSLDHAARYPNYRALNDKLILARGLSAIGVQTPRLLAFVLRGRIHSLDSEEKGSPPAGKWLAEQAARHGGIVLKPVIGLAGSGLLFIQSSTSGLSANGAAVSGKELAGLVSGLDQYLITEQIMQAPYSAAVFPDTANTLRILTLWDYEANRPFLAAAVHRFGSTRSAPVDNFHAGMGGVCAAVDLASGMMGTAMTLNEEGDLCAHRHHPESGAAIAGVVVPMWAETVAAVLRAASALSEAPFIGWDIILSNRGPVFIEANVPPSIQVWQIHGGLLRNPRARAFFEAQGMIGLRRRQRNARQFKATTKKGPADCHGSRSVRRKTTDQAAGFPGGIPGKVFSGYPLPLRERMRLRLVKWRRATAFFVADRNDPDHASFPARMRAWRRGFSSRHWLLYDLDHHNPAEYVPDHADLNFGIRDANFRSPNDRLLFVRALSALGLLHPEPLAYLARGRVFPFGPAGVDRHRQGTWLAREAVKRRAVVLKPVNGPSKNGVIILQDAGHRLTANGNAVTVVELDRLLAGLDQYTVSEHIDPASYATAISPSFANALHILTLWDVEANLPFVAAAVHRFGNACPALSTNDHTANGLIANIELGSGKMGTAVAVDERGVRCRYENHPGTGSAIAGVTVPRWAETVAAVLRAASALPQTPLIGWEIVISEKGPAFVAGHAPPELWIWQVHGGLLCDPRTRTFFEIHYLIPS